jgi:cyclic pyranopterin phosphate synthase
MSDRLTHLDSSGAARMVDIGAKPETERVARARGRVRMRAETLALALSGDAKKGNVRAVAELAGVMAAKRTGELIPLCHSLPLTAVLVTIEADATLPGVTVTSLAKTFGRTGVEMEALTAVSVACLTIYDMLKATDRDMSIEQICLLSKSGGASGDYQRGE